MKVIRQSDLTAEPVSHAQYIDKYVFIRNGEIPHLTNFSTAVLCPSAMIPAHSHEDMYEIFFIQSGCVEFCVDGQNVTLERGSSIIISPSEMHALSNNGSTDVHILYFGLV